MKDIIIEKLKHAQKNLDQAWEGYRAEKDPHYQDLYISDIGKAKKEITRLESLLEDVVELENKIHLY